VQQHVGQLRVVQRVIADHAADGADQSACQRRRQVGPEANQDLEGCPAGAERCLDDQVP
jgi:hypothetical protein